MIKLFKYNWRFSATGFYITMVAIALIYALLLYGKFQWDWYDEAIFVLGTMVSAFSVLLLIGIVCMNFNHGMKSYHRRLLPVSPIAEMASTLLLAIVYAITTVVFSLAFFTIATKDMNFENVNIDLSSFFSFEAIMTLVLLVIWSTISIMTLLLFSITSSYCFRGRFRAWIGVAVFILSATISDYVTSRIIGSSNEQFFSFIEFNFEATEGVTGGILFSHSNYQFLSLPFLIEVIGIAVLVGATYYLIKRRIQL